MTTPHSKDKPVIETWGRDTVRPGEERDVTIDVGESYLGAEISIPAVVRRGPEPGPTLLLTAAVHGDELNGTGAIRQLIIDPPVTLQRGALILAPVVNVFGFERHSRYMPDRRDLNRSFPGSADGSLTSRLAAGVFEQLVRRADYCIDLHTASVRRVNFPNIRGDMKSPRVAELARAFGSELIVSGRGPKGSLRRTACDHGVPTVILEAGEVWKVEPRVVEYTLRGVRSVLAHLGMTDEQPRTPAYRIETDATKWVRALHGGFLRFHVAPGDFVDQHQPIATNTSLIGKEQNVIEAPREGVVLGMTTLPSVSPGDVICHLAFARERVLDRAVRAVDKLDDDSLHERIRQDLARSVWVSTDDD